MRLEGGILFHSRYSLVKLIGRGGFSEVWLAKDTLTDLEIVIKVYAPGNGMDQNGLKVFIEELKKTLNLNHSNLLKAHWIDAWDNMPYLLMTYCPDGSCSKYVGKMTEHQIWKLIKDVASGLAYLHTQDIIHQDIKPDNILIDQKGDYVIIDFGVSTQAQTVLRKSVNEAGNSGGTIAYMAPERFSKSPAPIKASDIWSLGAMVFELLEGQTPFSEMGGGLQKSGAEIPDMKKQISDALKFVIHKMLSKDPWDRPKAEDLVEWSKDPQKIEIKNTPTIDELFLDVTPKTLTIPAEGGESTIYVKTNGICLPNYDARDWFKVISNSQDSFKIKAEANKTGKVREWTVNINSYNSSRTQNKSESILIKQTSLPKKSSLWWLWCGLIGFILFIILICVSNDECSRTEVNNLKTKHNAYVVSFNTYINSASLEDVNYFESAYIQLEGIKEIENNLCYNGSCLYTAKKQELLTKLSSVKKELDKSPYKNYFDKTDKDKIKYDNKVFFITQLQNKIK